MKRFLWTIALLSLAGAPCTYAQAIDVTQDIGFAANFGGGDNLGSSLIGPGLNLSAGGGTNCLWCTPLYFFNTPGSSLYPSTEIFYDSASGSLSVGGQTYCQMGECSLFAQELTAYQSITFPTNGQNFTVTIPVQLSAVTLNVAPSTQPFFNITLYPAQGDLTLSFDFAPAFPGGPPDGYYIFSQGTFPSTPVSTPEPGPLGLMAAGLIGILALGLTRRLSAYPDSR
jgi:hypothetical protein